MISLYINNTNSRIKIHRDPNCRSFWPRDEKRQRIIQINEENAESVLLRLANKEIMFKARAGFNDVRIYIDINNLEREESTVTAIKESLGRFYSRLASAEITTHCIPRDNLAQNSRSYKTAGSTLPYNGTHSIREFGKKADKIIETIVSRISEFNSLYRSGPSLYFYQKVLECRRKHARIHDFLEDNYSLEILYATLVAWDMDSRGAKLKYFEEFGKSLLICKEEFEEIENLGEKSILNNEKELLSLLQKAYEKLKLMETAAKLVSNAKCFHFLFPKICMPMDGTNTLQYLYGNTNETLKRYLDIIRFSFELMRRPIAYETYLDNKWNQTIPKLIDNAIILLQGKSTKNSRGGEDELAARIS